MANATTPGLKFDGLNATFAGDVTISKDGTQLRLKKADGTDDDWRFYSWTSGLNIFPQTASTIFFGRDGQTADVNVWNGDFIVDTDTLFVDASANKVGIGTNSPASNLHVKTSVDNSVTQGLIIERSANSDRGYINYNGGGFQFRSTVGDPIVFGETDAEHVRIIPDGNVGIGTDNPSELLTLNKASGGVGILLEGNGTDVGKFKVASAGVNHAVQIGTISNNEVQFHTNDSEKMRITNGGEIYFDATGTTAAAIKDGAFLYRNDNNRYLQFVTGTNNDTTSLYLYRKNSADNGVQIFGKIGNSGLGLTIGSGGNDNTLILDANENATFAGNVGIKESNIDANLHITDTNPNIKFERSGQGKWAFGMPNGQTYLAFDETSDDLSTPTMVLTKTTKRVGIGTTSPENLLHIKAADGVTGVLKIEGGKSTVTSVGEINSQIDFGSNDGSVWSTGNVGGRIASVTETTNGAFTGLAFYTFRQGASAPDTLSEKVRITNEGKVGINLTNPTSTLTIKASDNAYTGGINIIDTDSSTKSGITHVNGSLFLSHDASTDDLVLSSGAATFAGDVMPAAENLYNIGSASVRWEDLYVDDGYIRNAYIDDKIIHNGDDNTWIHFETDVISLRTGGTDRLTLTDSAATFAENVDIYTGTGLATLNIGRNSNEKLQIDQTDYETVLTAYNDSDADGDHNFRLNRVFQGSGANNFKIQKGGTDQFTIDTNGAATFAGDVSVEGDGSDFFVKSADYTIARIIPRGSGSAVDKGLFSLMDDGTEDVRIDTGGNSWINTGYNLGLGTNSPASKFETKDGDIRVTTLNSFSKFKAGRASIPSAGGFNLGGLHFEAYSTGTTYTTGSAIESYADGAAWTSTSTPSYLSFQTVASGSTSLTERMRIESDGDVQIQTVGAQLRFQNSVGAAPYIKNSGEDSSTAPYGQNLEFYTGGSKTLTLDNSQNATFEGTVKGTTYLVNHTSAAGIGASLGDINSAELGPGYLSLSRDDTADAKQIVFEKNDAEHSYLQTTSTGLTIGGSYVGMGIAATSNQRLTLAEADANGSHIKMNNSRSGGGYWVNGVGDSASSSSITPAGGIFWYNGTTRMVIDSSGNVGIGTTSPAFTNGSGLEIEKSGTATLRLQSAGSNASELNQSATEFTIADLSSGTMRFKTSNTTALVLDSSQNATFEGNTVTIDPASGDATLLLQSSTQTLRLDQNSIRTTTNSDLSFFTNGNARQLYLDQSTGGVGIGTNNAQADLQIGEAATNGSYSMMVEGNFADNNLSSNPRINLIDTNFGITAGKYGSGGADDAIGIFAYQGTGRGILFAHTTAGSGTHLKDMRHDMFVDGGTGNVGIGETTPLGKLHVKSADAGSITTNAAHDDVIIEGSGNTGINIFSGTSSYQYLAFGDTGGANRGYVRYSHSDDQMVLRAGATDTVYVDAGNVGIGAASSGYKLELTGSGHERVKITSTGNATAGIYLRAENGGSLVGNATIRVDNAGNINFYNGTSSAAERMRLETDGDLHADGDVVAYSTTISDNRLKDDVVTIDSALDKVSKLRGVEYTWNATSRKGQKDIGVIAQEVEEVIPEIVREKEMALIDGGKYKTVDYEKLTAVLIEAVKELKEEVEELKNKCNDCTC